MESLPDNSQIEFDKNSVNETIIPPQLHQILHDLTLRVEKITV